MHDFEKEIFGYLLQFNQKTLLADITANNIATVLARGFIRIEKYGEQYACPVHTLCIVPDHLWKVLEQHKDNFPQNFSNSDQRPWFDPWDYP